MQQQPSRLVFQAVILAAVLFSAIGWTLDQQQTVSDAKNGQAAQAAPKPATTTGQVPTLTSRTDLVLVPGISHDRSGGDVKGIGKHDFYLDVTGEQQENTIFT